MSSRREDLAGGRPYSDGWTIASLVILLGVVLASKYLFPNSEGSAATPAKISYVLLTVLILLDLPCLRYAAVHLRSRFSARNPNVCDLDLPFGELGLCCAPHRHSGNSLAQIGLRNV
jgi:hypothetical protein